MTKLAGAQRVGQIHGGSSESATANAEEQSNNNAEDILGTITKGAEVIREAQREFLKRVGFGGYKSPIAREIQAEEFVTEGAEKGIGRRRRRCSGFQLGDVDDNGHLGEGIAGIEGWVAVNGKGNEEGFAGAGIGEDWEENREKKEEKETNHGCC